MFSLVTCLFDVANRPMSVTEVIAQYDELVEEIFQW